MDKVKKYIKNNKGITILIILSFILMIIISFILFEFIKERNSNQYGSRLEGIEEVKISKKKLNSIEKKLEDKEMIISADLRIQGKIIYINVTFKKDSKLENAKLEMTNLLSNFDEDELDFYDLSCFLIEENDENDDTNEFKITGNKHQNYDDFTYIKS